MNLVEFNAVSKAFDGRKVLDALSFTVEQGEILAVVGPSGTGKSVTLRHIVGLIEPDSGRITVRTGRIGYLFQSGALLAWMTIFDNVALPLRETTDLDEAEIERRVNAALTAVGLAEAAERYPAEVSGGMLKRAGLARSIVRDAELILYDEPTSGLDPVTALAIDRLIARLNAERGITSVVVTHDIASALRLANRILLLRDGRAMLCATPADFVRSELPEAVELLSAMRGGN